MKHIIILLIIAGILNACGTEWPTSNQAHLTTTSDRIKEYEYEIRGQVQFSTLWGHWGGGAPGAFGTPNLLGCGLLQPGTPAKIDLTNTPPNALILGMISTTSITPNSFFGGTLHPAPPPLGTHLLFFANGVGQFSATVPWPPGFASGTIIWIQFLVQDATVPPDGVSMSNALRLVTP